MQRHGPVLFTCEIDISDHAVLKNTKSIRVNRRTGQRFIGSNDRVIHIKNELITKLYKEKARNYQDLDPIKDWVNLKILFIYPPKKFFTLKKEVSKLIADTSNLYQIIEDCLQKVGVLHDDRLVASHDDSDRLWHRDNGCKLIIEVRKRNNAMSQYYVA